MKLIIKIITLLILTFSFLNVNASEINPVAKNWFTGFSNKIEKKYNNLNKEVEYFKFFNKKLELLKIKKRLNSNQINLVNDLISLSNEFIFNKELTNYEYKNKKEIEKYSIIKDFKYKSFNNDHIFKKDGIWYTYIFNNHLYFDTENYKIKSKDLSSNNIYANSSLVFVKDDGRLGFVNDFKIRKLISDEIIYGVSGKYNFLSELKDDKKKLNYETDKVFIQLKDISKKLTKGEIEIEKIKILYSYVINNVKYTENFSFDQANLFSGIHTFANGEGVCEGYVKMFLYMLNFAGIDDVKAIRGYVLDAPDFPEVGHAWISIGDKYYDPTFDDPIGQTKTKTFEEYNYFNLPYDLFYTNRYTFEKIPDFLKNKSLDYRKKFINKRIASLLNKYENSGYNILKPFLFKKKNNIDLDNDITIEDIIRIKNIYTVENWVFYKDGIKKHISNINYYTVNDENIETVVSQLNYNLDSSYLFKWKLENGTYEYRLAYKVNLN